MKFKLLSKKDKSVIQNTKPIKKISLKDDSIEVQQKERTFFQIPAFQQFSTLMKLRIVVSTIFALCTISMIIIFMGGWVISAVLLLLGYILLFILLIKLFIIKKI